MLNEFQTELSADNTLNPKYIPHYIAGLAIATLFSAAIDRAPLPGTKTSIHLSNWMPPAKNGKSSRPSKPSVGTTTFSPRFCLMRLQFKLTRLMSLMRDPARSIRSGRADAHELAFW